MHVTDMSRVMGEKPLTSTLTLTEAARLLGSGSSTTFARAIDHGLISAAVLSGAVRSRPMLDRAEVIRFNSTYVTLVGLRSGDLHWRSVLAILKRARIEPVLSGSEEGHLYVRADAEAALALARTVGHA